VVTHKTELEVIDGTPEKRFFLSLISDYNLKTGLCELVDNAIDFWTNAGASTKLLIEVGLDPVRQHVRVIDNAGGVQRENIRLLIAPGATGNAADKEVIGIFGVGGKRAAVALGERVEIKSRYKKGKSLQIDLTSDWLTEAEEWKLPVYEIPDMAPGCTVVDVSMLRQAFNEEDVEVVREHLSETYDWFLRNGCEIKLNGSAIVPISFDHWGYPPNFKPQEASFEIFPTAHGKLKVSISAGLIIDRDPERENYGVYVYCNHRLIVKELRTRDVGYLITSEAGVPHPDASLCRVIINFQGSPELMPWNSSKSDINPSRPAFAQIRPIVITLVKHFTKLSRSLKNDWEGEVFRYPTGEKHIIDPAEIETGKKITLPEIPRTRSPPRLVELKARNRTILQDQPWTLGLVEVMGLLEVIAKQKLDTKNRIALILLDSNFEIALKEFIVNRHDLFPPQVYTDAKIVALFKARHQVINEVRAHVKLSATLLTKVAHYYNLRNKLVHERATVGITDHQITDYRRTVELVLKKLFKLKFPRAD
jgi:anti-sigma regulatory factor (Ser/Thr protein kinase)